MLILMINFIHKLVRQHYKHQEIKLMNGKFRHTPRSQWANHYPIVLVHGFMGYGPDASYLLGNYFQYAYQKSILNHNEDVYIAVISPLNGIHDRACELYQQLVGITNIRKRAGL